MAGPTEVAIDGPPASPSRWAWCPAAIYGETGGMVETIFGDSVAGAAFDRPAAGG